MNFPNFQIGHPIVLTQIQIPRSPMPLVKLFGHHSHPHSSREISFRNSNKNNQSSTRPSKGTDASSRTISCHAWARIRYLHHARYPRTLHPEHPHSHIAGIQYHFFFFFFRTCKQTIVHPNYPKPYKSYFHSAAFAARFPNKIPTNFSGTFNP